MSESAYEQMLSQLAEERRTNAAALALLRRQLVDAEVHQQRLDAAIGAIRQLLPETSAQPAEPLRFPERIAESFFEVYHPAAKSVPILGEQVAEEEPAVEDGPKRVPSREWVTEVVLDAGRPMRREDVQAEVLRRYGEQASWSDPQAAVGIALKRASVQGSIQRLSRGLYAPPDWNEMRENLSDDQEAVSMG